MGNRALIKFENENLGVYLHWNGSYESQFWLLHSIVS